MTVAFRQGAEASDSVYISGMPPTATEADLKVIFERLGIKLVWCKATPDRGAGTCTALLQCETMEDSCLAIASLNGRRFSEALHDDVVLAQDELWPDADPPPLGAAPGEGAPNGGAPFFPA